MPTIKEILKMRALFATVKELEVQVSTLKAKDVEYATSISVLADKITALENA